jgi:hypothetical protein
MIARETVGKHELIIDYLQMGMLESRKTLRYFFLNQLFTKICLSPCDSVPVPRRSPKKSAIFV